MRIRVIEQVPVAAVSVGGRQVAVAGDGTCCTTSVDAGSLPQIPLRRRSGRTRD